MQFRLRLYVSAISVAAAAIAAGAYAAFPTASTQHLVAAMWLASLGVFAELLTYQMAGGAIGSIALIPFLATALIAPDCASLAAVGCAVTVAGVVRKRPSIKLIFNSAQAVLSIASATVVFRLLGGTSLLDARDFVDFALAHLGAIVALLVVFVLVNSLAVSGVVSITENDRFIDLWRRNTLATALYTVCSGALAYGLAVVFLRWGIVGAALLSLPFIAVRQFYATTLQLQQTNRELLELMVKAIEARDPYTSGHSRRVAESATIIARGIGLSSRDVERVRIAALLHDLGKIDEIYAPILRKEGKLSTEEWEIMKTHPARGAELVATLSDLQDVVAPIRHHHEHWNGRGYPDGLAGEAIPLAARIITFADTMDALTTDRPYRPALGEHEVRSEFVKFCGTQFDPTICGHVLSPAVWGQLFPGSTQETRRPRFSVISNPKARAVAS